MWKFIIILLLFSTLLFGEKNINIELVKEIKGKNTLLKIKTIPKDVDIYIDNTLIATSTPASFILANGSYVLVFKKKGYETVDGVLNIEEDTKKIKEKLKKGLKKGPSKESYNNMIKEKKIKTSDLHNLDNNKNKKNIDNISNIGSFKMPSGLGEKHTYKYTLTRPSKNNYNKIKKDNKISLSDMENNTELKNDNRDTQNINNNLTEPKELAKDKIGYVKNNPNKDNYDKINKNNYIVTSDLHNNTKLKNDKIVQNVSNGILPHGDFKPVTTLTLADIKVSGRIGLRAKFSTKSSKDSKKIEFENITELSLSQQFDKITYKLTFGTFGAPATDEKYYSNRWADMGSFKAYSLSLGIVEVNLNYKNKDFSLTAGRFKNSLKNKFFLSSYYLFNGLELQIKDISNALTLKNITSILKQNELNPSFLNIVEIALNLDNLDFALYYFLLHGDDINTLFKGIKYYGGEVYVTNNHYLSTSMNYKIKFKTGILSLFADGAINISIDHNNLAGDVGLKYKAKKYSLKTHLTYKDSDSVIAPFAPTGAIVNDIMGVGGSLKYKFGKSTIKFSTFVGQILHTSNTRSETKLIWEMKF